MNHAVRLKTLTRPEGRIRLSEDDGPPATEFLGDDYDEDDEPLDSNDTRPTVHVLNGYGHAAGVQAGDERQPI